MSATPSHPEPDDIATLHLQMVDRLKNQGLLSTPQLEAAFRAIPRHLFVSGVDLATAYSDVSLAADQQADRLINACAQPSLIALMLTMLDLQPGQRVLEIGTGTAYMTALLAHLTGPGGQVVTMELDPEIADSARSHLQAVEATNVQVVLADGEQGWPEGAPYDRIILAAAFADISPAWYTQLHLAGRLVLPFALTSFQSELALIPDQFLLALERTATGFSSLAILPAGLDLHPANRAARQHNFVPLRGSLTLSSTASTASSSFPGLSYVSSADIDPATAFHVLSSQPQTEPTHLSTTYLELWGLRLWLALRDPRYCELYLKDTSASTSSLPSLFHISDTFYATVGLYDQATWSLLQLEEDTSPAKDLRRPFKLTIQQFGPDQTLTEHLRQQVLTWDSAGRQFTLSAHKVFSNLQLQAHPQGTDYSLQPHDILLKKRWTHFIFKAGGTIDVQLREDANLLLSVPATGTSSAETQDMSSTGGFAYRTFGSGQASLDIMSGANIHLHQN